jgi:phosphoribosylamine--glycine ligase
MGFCDGRHFIPLPDTRDYKRAFDDDKGPNTGGMGSYKDVVDWLPFLNAGEREQELALANKVFKGWKAKISDDTALRGVPLYLAFMHTGKGIKILEINSRPGDPEIMNLLPIIKDDFVDVCLKMAQGNLRGVALEKSATVLTYKVPADYGCYAETFQDKVDKTTINTPVDITKAQALTKKYGDKIRIYPGSMELRDKKTLPQIPRHRHPRHRRQHRASTPISQEGAKAIIGGALWNRTDVASKQQPRSHGQLRHKH